MFKNALIGPENNWVLFAILVAIASLSIWLEQTYKWAARMTGAVIALIGAAVLSNLNIIPTDAPAYDFVWDYVVPLAIPLLLFNSDIKRIWRESGRMLLIYILSSFGTIAGAFIAYYLLRGVINGLAPIVTMMIGSYTGGSVNLVAMANAFHAPSEMVSSTVVADNLLMAIYFFVLLAATGSSFMLKHFRHPIIDKIESPEHSKNGDKQENIAASWWRPKEIALKDIAKALAIAFVIVACSEELAACFKNIIPREGFGLTLLNGLLGNMYLVITTITVLVSTLFPKFIGVTPGAQELGTFLIHIFLTVIGVPASLYMILAKAPLLLVFCAIIIAINMLVSFVCGKLLGFNLEEIILASNANIGGPTTAAAMAISRGWTSLVIPSILVGTLGYVIGNYYGIFAGTLLGL